MMDTLSHEARPASTRLAEPSLLVAFRTHVWNRDVERLAARLHDHCQGVRFVVLADETNGILETGQFEKISHNNDFSSFGIPNFPAANVLWYNGDYPLYVLRRECPDCSHYAMVEYDVAVNFDFAAMMRHAQARQIDLIAHNTWRTTPEWDWYYTVEQYFRRPWQSFIAAAIFSGRAVDHMLNRRRQLHYGQTLNVYADWPFCEGFAATVIAELAGARMEELRTHAHVGMFTHINSHHIDDPLIAQAGSIAHPVLSGKVFIRKRLALDGVMTIFDPGSPLRRHLSFCDPADFLDLVYQDIRFLRSPEDEDRFFELGRENGWPVEILRRNVARGKPALSSSTCEHSRFADRALDAGGGNDGHVGGGFGFYTAYEQNPWWQVDLQADHAITKIVLFNYLDWKHIARQLEISGSADGQDWQTIAAKRDDRIFGGADGDPYQVTFAPPVVARFIRITLQGEAHLHLDEIEIFGEPMAAATLPR